MSVVRVVLDEEAFAALVKGDMATVRGVTANGVVSVEIILSDIGFAQMRRAIERAADARIVGDGPILEPLENYDDSGRLIMGRR